MNLQAQCEAAIRDYIDKANARWPKIQLAYPRVTWDLTGSTAGLANPRWNTIQLHSGYLIQDPDDYIPNTAGHEVAHLVAANIHRTRPIKAHGDEWAQVMWTFRLAAIRCHRYNAAPSPKTEKAKRGYRSEHGIVRPINVGNIIEFE